MAGWTSVRACQRRVRLVPPPQPDGMDKLRPLLGLEAQVILASTVREFRVKGLGICMAAAHTGKSRTNCHFQPSRSSRKPHARLLLLGLCTANFGNEG